MNAAADNTRPSAPMAAPAEMPGKQAERSGLALSALADGESVSDAEWAGCWAAEEGADANDASWADRWESYHLIGEVLRGTPDVLASRPSAAFLAGVRSGLAQEAQRELVAPAPVLPAAAPVARGPAANDPVFRWKLLAAAASLAAVMAVSWSVLGTAPGSSGGVPSGGQLALLSDSTPLSAPAKASGPEVAARGAPAAQAVVVDTPLGPVIRDAHLEERLAEHRRYGGMSALQMPAGFVRNATYDAPGR